MRVAGPCRTKRTEFLAASFSKADAPVLASNWSHLAGGGANPRAGVPPQPMRPAIPLETVLGAGRGLKKASARRPGVSSRMVHSMGGVAVPLTPRERMR